MRYKCHTCHSIFESDKEICDCGETVLERMCVEDRLCTCMVDQSTGLTKCPTCGQYTCPCGSHDVVVISRVTGYLSDAAGWNAGKRQELKDRQRVSIN
jgi:anaerobic ribonucleoside-triphosphate reductase